MKLWLALLFSATGLNSGHAQDMLAGILGPGDLHTVLDTTLLGPTENGVNSLLIDANEDGTADLRVILTENDGGNWYHYQYIQVEPLLGSEIAGSAIDTCMGNDTTVLAWVHGRAATFSYGEHIPGLMSWSDSSLTVARSDWSSNYPTAWGASCGQETQLEEDTGYVAFRIFTGVDTLLGWMRMCNVRAWFTSHTATILDLAVRNISNTINEHRGPAQIFSYPNPTTGIIHLQGVRSNMHYEVLDAAARPVLTGSLPMSQPSMDLSALPSGSYIIRCANGDRIHHTRVVLTH